jgi:hypothetical protein
VNGAFAALLITGYVYDIQGARNVVIGCIVFFTFIAFRLLMVEVKAQKPRPVPLWLDATYDTVVTSFLFWHGAWWLAGMYVFHSLALLHYFEKKLDCKSNT